MKIKKKVIALTVASTMLWSSASYAGDHRELISSLLGATGGAWIGSNVGKGKGNVVAIAAGTLLGSGIGKSVGSSLYGSKSHYKGYSRYDNHHNYNQYSDSRWVSPVNYTQSVYSYPGQQQQVQATTVSMTTSPVVSDTRYCREYIHTVQVAGKPQQSYGQACQKPDGSWEIQ